MRAARWLLLASLALLAPAACPAAGASPGAADCPTPDFQAPLTVCVQSFEAGSGIPYWGGACVWIDGNGNPGVDPEHPCSISSA